MISGEQMDLVIWEPIYEAIITDLGFDRREDERARDCLAALLQPYSLDRLSLDGERVAIVAGAALGEAAIRSLDGDEQLVCTGDALARLQASGRPVRLVVTDLDSDPARVCRRSHRGGAVSIHAHGDNIDLLESWVPRMNRSVVVGTTQVRPIPPLCNVGGFTDGDRAAFIADHLGADSLRFVGWDLESSTVSSSKRRKLDWAIRLLLTLEDERGERYPMLDGLRDAFDPIG